MSTWHNGRFIGRYAAYIQTPEATYPVAADVSLNRVLQSVKNAVRNEVDSAVDNAVQINGGTLSEVKRRAVVRKYYDETTVHIYGFSGFWDMREVTERCTPHGWIPDEYHFRSYRFTNRGGLK